jgi:hypothetical protein
MRAWPPHRDGYSENFASLNRNKRSVVLNLKDPGQLAAAKKLCLSSDVVLEDFRPGVMARLGLGYETLAREKRSSFPAAAGRRPSSRRWAAARRRGARRRRSASTPTRCLPSCGFAARGTSRTQVRPLPQP